jgi:hypothetical protein
MEGLQWIGEHWFDLLQTVGIVGGLLFTAYTTKKDDRSRKIANLIAIKQQYREIWKELYDRPQLGRVLEKTVDLMTQPVSLQEWLFVKLLILHMDTVHRAMKTGMFVSLEGLRGDIREFFSAPVPKIVWERMKALQDTDFVQFIDSCIAEAGVMQEDQKSRPAQSLG